MSGTERRYHHGDLRHALIEAGVALAREGGPEAVVLREATRRAGVTVNAAYRHFADRADLLAQVCARGQAAAAGAMEAELALIPALGPAAHARAALRAVGAGYVWFARAEPGLFRAAFFFPDDLSRTANPASAGPGGRTPFQLLTAALDGLAAAGVLPADRRPGAEFLAWSAVHGLAALATAGPLRVLPDGQLDALTERLLDMVLEGLPAPVVA